MRNLKKYTILIAVAGLIILGLTTANTHTVQYIIDGDTFVLDNGERVRIIGIDAPEVGEEGAKGATWALKQYIGGEVVTLTKDRIQPNKDRYGRLLRYVWVDSRDIGRLLVEGGFAEVYGGNFEKKGIYQQYK